MNEYTIELTDGTKWQVKAKSEGAALRWAEEQLRKNINDVREVQRVYGWWN